MKALKTEHKGALLCLKYIPIIMFLSMGIYTILAFHGIPFILCKTLMGCAIFPSIIIFSLTRVFQFCGLHKAMTLYALVTDLMININFYATLGTLTPIIQILFIIIGFVMLLMLLFKLERFKNSFTYFKLRKYDAPLFVYLGDKQKKEPK